jgi:hypothetical protein
VLFAVAAALFAATLRVVLGLLLGGLWFDKAEMYCEEKNDMSRVEQRS